MRAQNEASRAHLDALASRPWFLRTLRSIVGRPRAGTPEKVGGRYVVSRNDGTQEQDVWFVGETLDDLRPPEPAAARPQHVLRGRHLLAGRLRRQPRRPLAGLPGQRRRQRLDHDPAAGARHRPRGRRRRHEGEVQRGHLAAGPLVVPLPHVPHHRQRRRHRGRGARRRPADAALRRRVAGHRRAGPGAARRAERHPRAHAVPRRPLARGAPARRHVGEEPAVAAARSPPTAGRARSASRCGSSTRRTPASSWSASTAPRSTC